MSEKMDSDISDLEELALGTDVDGFDFTFDTDQQLETSTTPPGASLPSQGMSTGHGATNFLRPTLTGTLGTTRTALNFSPPEMDHLLATQEALVGDSLAHPLVSSEVAPMELELAPIVVLGPMAVAAVELQAAAKKAKFPKLKAVDLVLDWLEDVTDHINVQQEAGDISSAHSWALVIRSSIDSEATDPQLAEFRALLYRSLFNSNETRTVRILTPAIEEGAAQVTPLQRLQAAVRVACFRPNVQRPDISVAAPGGTEMVSRPLQAADWLADCIYDGFLTTGQRDHYANVLAHTFYEPTGMTSLEDFLNHFTHHVRAVDRLLRLSGTENEGERLRKFRQTLVRDGEILTEATKARDIAAANLAVRQVLSARYLNQQGMGQAQTRSAVATTSAGASAMDPIQNVLAEVRSLLGSRGGSYRGRGANKAFGGRQGQHAGNGGNSGGTQGSAGQQRNGGGKVRSSGNNPGRALFGLPCYFCGKEGHIKNDCPDKRNGLPPTVPQPSNGESASRMAKNFVKNKKGNTKK